MKLCQKRAVKRLRNYAKQHVANRNKVMPSGYSLVNASFYTREEESGFISISITNFVHTDHAQKLDSQYEESWLVFVTERGKLSFQIVPATPTLPYPL